MQHAAPEASLLPVHGELVTPNREAPAISGGSVIPGGAEGDRTPDLVIANDALSHLSYGPVPGIAPRCATAGSAAISAALPR